MEGFLEKKPWSGWETMTLSELQVCFQNRESIRAFERDEARTFFQIVCSDYSSALDMTPVLEWFCAPPHSLDIDAILIEAYGMQLHFDTPFMSLVERGNLRDMETALRLGANIHVNKTLLVSGCIYKGATPVHHTVLDTAMRYTHIDKRKATVLFLLDRGARTLGICEMPNYGRAFIERREPTRRSAIAWLVCWKRRRFNIDRHVATMVARTIWDMRFNVHFK